MFDAEVVDFKPSPGSLDLRGCPILIDQNDFEGIKIAAHNLAADLERVTGLKSPVWTSIDQYSASDGLIVVGSVQKCKYIDPLVSDGSLDISKIKGKWESFTTSLLSSSSLPKRSLVIAGSDKRGAIFGTYTVCEQIGVSP